MLVLNHFHHRSFTEEESKQFETYVQLVRGFPRNNLYLIPPKEFGRLEKILSKRFYEKIRKKGGLVSAADICLLCNKSEKLKTLEINLDNKVDKVERFSAFPREVYQLEVSVGLKEERKSERIEEIINAYLEKHAPIVKKAVYEVVLGGGWSYGQITSSRREHCHPLDAIESNRHRFIANLKQIVEKSYLSLGDLYSYEDRQKNLVPWEFRLCAKHNAPESFYPVRQRLIEETIERFKPYDIELKKEELEVVFIEDEMRDKKIFSLESKYPIPYYGWPEIFRLCRADDKISKETP